MRRLKTVRRPPIYPKTPGHLPCSSLTHPLPLSSRRLSVSFGGFGLKPDHVAIDVEFETAGAVEIEGAWVPSLSSVDPGQKWSLDFVPERTMTGRRFRALAIVDDYSRECPAIEVDISLGGARVVGVLERLAETWGLSEVSTVDRQQ